MDNIETISKIHANCWNKQFLCEYIDKYIVDSKWGNTSAYIIAKIYLSCIVTKLCIKKNNFNIPKELWEIICGFIVDEIKFYEGRMIKDYASMRFGKNNYDCPVIDLKKYFMQGTQFWKVNPEKILNFIDRGSVIIKYYFDDGYDCYYDFLIVINIDIERKIIEFMEDFEGRHSLQINENNVEDLSEMDLYFFSSITKVLNYHEFIFTADYVLILNEKNKKKIGKILSNLKFESI